MNRPEMSVQERAARRAGALSGVLWHVATYLIINAFLWFIDSLQLGIEWAYWVSITWGIAIAFHAAWYLITEREVSKYRSALDQERRT